MSITNLPLLLGNKPLDQDNLDATFQKFSNAVTRSSLSSYIRFLLNDATAMSNLVSAAYVHQLGFEKYTLPIYFGNEMKLRLHIWRQGTHSPYAEDIHNHRHAFVSKVLIGGLDHLIYEHSTDSLGDCNLFSYTYSDSTQLSSQEYLGSCSIRESRSFSINAGDVYFFDQNTLHQVHAKKPLTVTVLLQGECCNRNVKVIKSNRCEPIIEVRGVGSLTDDYIKNTLHDLADKLDG